MKGFLGLLFSTFLALHTLKNTETHWTLPFSRNVFYIEVKSKENSWKSDKMGYLMSHFSNWAIHFAYIWYWNVYLLYTPGRGIKKSNKEYYFQNHFERFFSIIIFHIFALHILKNTEAHWMLPFCRNFSYINVKSKEKSWKSDKNGIYCLIFPIWSYIW